MRYFFLKAALLLMGTSPLLTCAQSAELGLEIFTSNVMSQTNVLLGNSAVEASMNNARAGSTSRGRAVASTRTTYAPSAAATQQALGTQQTSMKLAGAQAQQFATLFGPGGRSDYAGLYKKVIAGTGLRDHDAADAYVAYLLASYQLAHGASPLVPATVTRAVRAQFVPTITRELAGKSTALRAGVGEYLKLQTALLYLASQRPTPKLRQDVVARFKERAHLDVLTLQLTNRGFVRK